jgi:hypothetical protein
MYYLLLIGAVPIWHNPDMLVALVVQYHSFTYILDCVWYMPVMLCISTSAAPSQPETAAVWVQQCPKSWCIIPSPSAFQAIQYTLHIFITCLPPKRREGISNLLSDFYKTELKKKQ